MAGSPEIYRDIPFRPPREKLTRGDLWQLVWRLLNEYCRGYRRLLALCVVLQLLAGLTPYALFFSVRHMVSNVIVVEQLPPPTLAAERAPLMPPSEPVAGEHEALADRGIGSEREVWQTAALFFVIVITLNLAGRLSRRLRVVASARIFGRLRQVIHRKILALDYENYQRQTTGRLMSYVITDVNAMDRLFLQALVMLAGELTMISVGLLVIFFLHWQLALAVGILLPLHGLLYLKVKQPQREASRELRHTNSCLWNFTTQRMNGIKTIMAYAQEPREALHFVRLAGCYLRDALFVSRCSAVIKCNAWLIMGLGTGTVMVAGTWLVLHHRLQLGDMVMFHGIVAFLFSRVLQVSNLNAWFAHISAVLGRVYRVLDTPIQIKDAADAEPLGPDVRGEIQFRHVTFDYPESNRSSLQELSITIAPGEWLCVMGPSGSGKSTLVSLLTRIREPQAGDIIIDGRPLPRIQLASLRENMVLVPQEPQIFSGTIADNICYGSGSHSPAAIMAAAKAAELHETIMDLPAKYETILGEKGVSLSGGQRQRLSLARALITDPRILILDDCTSALDAQTEKRIQATLSRVMQGRTAIIISQRISMALECDRVLVLNQGRVEACGTPRELLEQEGFFRLLHQRQAGREPTASTTGYG